jgi:hypothetical protein
MTPAQPCSATNTRQGDTLHVQATPMNLRILDESDRSVVQSCYVLHFYALPGATTSNRLVYWIHLRIPLLQEHHRTGRNESTTEIRLLVRFDGVSYRAITLAATNATKAHRHLPAITVAAPAVAGAEVCAGEDASTGVSVASAVSTASAFMPQKLCFREGLSYRCLTVSNSRGRLRAQYCRLHGSQPCHLFELS